MDTDLKLNKTQTKNAYPSLPLSSAITGKFLK